MGEKNFELTQVVSNLNFEGEFIKAHPYGFGHINDTFAIYFKRRDGLTHRYILQRINHHVFKEPEKLMQNIQGITQFLRNKIIQAKGDPQRETLNLIPAIDGRIYYKDSQGNYWRGYLFIEGAQTYQTVKNPENFYFAGKAFGRFQSLLSDYPAETLHETIPHFHDTGKRFEAFTEAVDKDIANRAALVQSEIQFVERRSKETNRLTDLFKAGELPLRVTHNDTKFNNVMIDDNTGRGICVIDLDTVMPGLSLYDYGDSIRSGTNTGEEDEKNLSTVWMDLKLYEQFTRGFLESAGGFLTPSEVEYLPFAAKMMTFECGMRFLTDYLSGDTYFKIHHKDHNLDRTRTQFKMVTDMEEKEDQMMNIVKSIMG